MRSVWRDVDVLDTDEAGAVGRDELLPEGLFPGRKAVLVEGLGDFAFAGHVQRVAVRAPLFRNVVRIQPGEGPRLAAIDRIDQRAVLRVRECDALAIR